MSEEQRQNLVRGLVDRKLVEAPPPVVFIAGRPKVTLLFWFLVILDLARFYLWLFKLYIPGVVSRCDGSG